MIAVTGAAYGPADLARLAGDPVVGSMGKGDFLVLLGGCGVFAPRTGIREATVPYRDLPCSVLFLDGPRDDYDSVAEQPPFPWNGGTVHTVSRGVTHLTRGQVFTLCGRTFLTMGGAMTPGRDEKGMYWDWWPEQDPVPGDADTAVSNADRFGGKVDFILSCDCPSSWKERVSDTCISPASEVLETVLGKVGYGHWYFSNHPFDGEFGDLCATCVSQKVLPVA